MQPKFAVYKNKPMAQIADVTSYSTENSKHITTGDGGIISLTMLLCDVNSNMESWLCLYEVCRRKSSVMNNIISRSKL